MSAHLYAHIHIHGTAPVVKRCKNDRSRFVLVNGIPELTRFSPLLLYEGENCITYSCLILMQPLGADQATVAHMEAVNVSFQ